MSERTELSIQAQAPLTELDNFGKLARKINSVMKMVERIPKNGWNDHFKFHFASEADVMDAVRKQCVESGLVIVPAIMDSHREGSRTILKMSFTFVDCDTGFSYTSFWEGEGQDTQDKGTSKAGTSGEKYFLLKAFMIPTGSDPDADGPEKQEKPKPPAKAKSAPKEPVASPVSTAGQYLTKDLEMTQSQYKEFIARYPNGTWVQEALDAKQAGVTNLTELAAFQESRG